MRSQCTIELPLFCARIHLSGRAYAAGRHLNELTRGQILSGQLITPPDERHVNGCSWAAQVHPFESLAVGSHLWAQASLPVSSRMGKAGLLPRRHSRLGGVSPSEFEAAHRPRRSGVHQILITPHWFIGARKTRGPSRSFSATPCLRARCGTWGSRLRTR